MKFVDLSMLMQPMWRWPLEPTLTKDINQGDPYQVTTITTGMHAFTHIDTPLHIETDRESIDEIELQRLCGPAAVIDLTPVTVSQEITIDLLRKRANHIEPGDIVLLKTNWDLLRDYTTREYWLDAPFLSLDAADWLSQLPIPAVGFDFPQDQVIREIPDRHPSPSEMPTHDLILRNGILLIEYLCNLDGLQANRVEVFALPLKLKGAEGGCARVVAIDRVPNASA